MCIPIRSTESQMNQLVILDKIFDLFDDSNLAQCAQVCRAWNRRIKEIQNSYKAKLRNLYLHQDYSLGRVNGFMGGVFSKIYNGMLVTSSPKQAYQDWRCYTHPKSRIG